MTASGVLARGATREALAALAQDLERLLESAPVDQAATAGDELFAVAVLLDEQTGLRRALSDPALAADRKIGLVDAVLGSRLGATSVQVVRDAVVRRWSRMRDLADALEQLGVLARLVAADHAGQADEVEDELFRFGRILQDAPALRDALANPGLPASNKVELMHALLDAKATPTTTALLTQFAAHPRGRTPEAGLAEYGDIAARRRRRLSARVTSAVELTDDEKERLRAALADLYDHDVHLHTEVDPDVVGGLVVQIGDEVIDGSVAGRLAQARQQVK